MLELTRYEVEQWIGTTTGTFHYKETLDGRVKPAAHGKLRKIYYDICHSKKPCCETVGGRHGYYRAIQELPEVVDWQSANPNQDFPVDLPFDLRKYVWIDKETLLIVAGSKDSGKSGLIMRTVAMNMNKMNVVYLSNMEGGVNQIKRRFDAMDIEIPTPAPFKLYYMTDNFHDAITESDTLYAIDYIDVPDSGEFYMIAPELNKIQSKLVAVGNSIALIGLQKKMGVDLAFGGAQTAKKASLYVAIDNSKLKIVHAKVRADKKVDPKNMQWTFLYSDEGTNFVNIMPFFGDD